jgi:Xaa-Pro aminopeptidase
MSSLTQLQSLSHLPVADAVRVAEIGYTAVIDRFTRRLSLTDVSANVGRSVGNAGGSPAAFPELAAVGSPVWQEGAVWVFEERHTHGPYDKPGPVGFAISAQASGTQGAVAATVVLDEPTPRLRRHASGLSGALEAALALIRDGVEARAVAAAYHDAVGRADLAGQVPATLGVPVVAGAAHTLRVDAAKGAVLREGESLALMAFARTEDGVITFGTTIRVSSDGAQRLDGIPLRLIELR